MFPLSARVWQSTQDREYHVDFGSEPLHATQTLVHSLAVRDAAASVALRRYLTAVNDAGVRYEGDAVTQLQTDIDAAVADPTTLDALIRALAPPGGGSIGTDTVAYEAPAVSDGDTTIILRDGETGLFVYGPD